MSGILKDRNKAFLSAVLAAHALAFWVIFAGANMRNFSTVEGLVSRFAASAPLAIFPALISFLVQGIVTSDVKARIVYWRVRGDPYPGSEAFSRWLRKDGRINAGVIEARYSPLPTSPADQNALWYRIYRTHRDDPNIEDAHRRYLLARDLAINALLFGAVTCLLIGWGSSSTPWKLMYILGSGGLYVFSCIAAQNHGRRFVTSVLANESAK